MPVNGGCKESADGIWIGSWTIIEFKNGDMKSEKRRVKDKIRDSLLLFCDITEMRIAETRKAMDFILVYNIEKTLFQISF